MLRDIIIILFFFFMNIQFSTSYYPEWSCHNGNQWCHSQNVLSNDYPIIRPNISNTMVFGIVSSETTLHQPRSESAIVVTPTQHFFSYIMARTRYFFFFMNIQFSTSYYPEWSCHKGNQWCHSQNVLFSFFFIYRKPLLTCNYYLLLYIHL
jgi:hypothetical protein